MQTGSPELSSEHSSQSFPSKRCQKFLNASTPPGTGAAYRGHYGLYLVPSACDVIIHDTIIVVLTEFRNLVARPSQAPRNFFVGILAAAAQPALQFFTRGRQNKNGHGLGKFLFYLSGSLDIDLQHEVDSLFSGFLQPLFWSAVGMLAEDLRVLQEFAALDHGPEFLVGNKIITFPASLGRAARPSGTGD